MVAGLKRWLHVRRGSSRGFTLIEMSIVLVIIGLIIGGILKGQEIIATARSKAVINEINAVRAAVNTYYDRYRALPGDDLNGPTRVDPRLVAGNGDGVVSPGNPVGPTTASGLTSFSQGNQSENYQYFKAMVATGLLNGAEVGPASTTQAEVFGTGSSLPASPVTGAGLTVVYGTHNGDGTPITAVTAHWLRLHKDPGVPRPAFTPRELANIDSQVDDGLPGEGGVRGDGSTQCAPQSQGAVYTLSDNVACVGFFIGNP
jgi:prepilin-type N-terminal cleavage/methylation domain-containing protein